jgi:hypothetical protein
LYLCILPQTTFVFLHHFGLIVLLSMYLHYFLIPFFIIVYFWNMKISTIKQRHIYIYMIQKTLTYTFHYWEFFCQGAFVRGSCPFTIFMMMYEWNFGLSGVNFTYVNKIFDRTCSCQVIWCINIRYERGKMKSIVQLFNSNIMLWKETIVLSWCFYTIEILTDLQK